MQNTNSNVLLSIGTITVGTWKSAKFLVIGKGGDPSQTQIGDGR